MMVSQHPDMNLTDEQGYNKWFAIMSIYITSLCISVFTLFSGSLDYGNQRVIFLSLASAIIIPFDVFKIRSYIDPALKKNLFFKVKPNPVKFAIIHLYSSILFMTGFIFLVNKLLNDQIVLRSNSVSISVSVLVIIGIGILFFYEFLTTHPLKYLMLGQPSWSRTRIVAFSDKKRVFFIRGLFIIWIIGLSLNLDLNPVSLLISSFIGSVIFLTASYKIEQKYFLNASFQIIEETKDSIPLGVNPKDAKRKWPFLSALGLEDDPLQEPSDPEQVPISTPIHYTSVDRGNPISTKIDQPSASKTLQKLIAKVKEEEDGLSPDTSATRRNEGNFAFCMNCGTRNNSLNTYCHACGASLQI